VLSYLRTVIVPVDCIESADVLARAKDLPHVPQPRVSDVEAERQIIDSKPLCRVVEKE
jgi:hypothetical protein